MALIRRPKAEIALAALTFAAFIVAVHVALRWLFRLIL